MEHRPVRKKRKLIEGHYLNEEILELKFIDTYIGELVFLVCKMVCWVQEVLSV